MALLDRVKERVETDLADPELTELIDEAQSEIRSRFGPDRDAEAPITATVDGNRRRLDVLRPIDADEDLEVVEYLSTWGLGETATTLAADDYLIRNDGRTLERVFTGTNPRRRWGTRVDVTYVPRDDQARRDEVTIKLVQLSIEYAGVASRRVGDTTTDYAGPSGSEGLIYTRERERLLTSLEPRKGLLLR